MKPFTKVLLVAVGAGTLGIVAGLWSNGPGRLLESELGQRALQQVLSASAPPTPDGLAVARRGEVIPTVVLPDLDGRPVTLPAAHAGRPLLVNFWASWCVPCREERPALDALATKYNSDAFMVLPINLDIGAGGLEKAQAFLDENSFANLPLYADNTFAAFERLKQQAVAVGLPATLVLDENGCELGVLQGPAEWNTDDGRAVIEALLSLGA